ncbi:MAG TPA: HAD-IA family hydrolase [Candidatus Saccharimonadales bacterium]|nr:HAD-IA family hydrolase [Candidatus Saccharimonadales bacterium]
MVMDEVGLGKRLQQVRRDAGYTQQQLCVQANLSYSTLAKIERGAIKAPSIFTIQSIATALGISLDELLGLETHRHSTGGRKQTSKSGVRFVFFDLNDCLIRFHTSAFTALARDSGQPVDVVESVFWKYDALVNRGEVTLDELNTIWAQRLGIMVDWKRYYLNAVDPMPGMEELVRWVADRYYVGILSNTSPGFIHALRERGLLPDVHYDAIVDSSEVGALKPEPRIYEAAAAKASLAPEEILLIDDSRPNLIAAENLGWHTLWFDAYNPEDCIETIRTALEA